MKFGDIFLKPKWLHLKTSWLQRIRIYLAFSSFLEPCSAPFYIPHLFEQHHHLPTVKTTNVEVLFFPLACPSPSPPWQCLSSPPPPLGPREQDGTHLTGLAASSLCPHQLSLRWHVVRSGRLKSALPPNPPPRPRRKVRPLILGTCNFFFFFLKKILANVIKDFEMRRWSKMIYLGGTRMSAGYFCRRVMWP